MPKTRPGSNKGLNMSSTRVITNGNTKKAKGNLLKNGQNRKAFKTKHVRTNKQPESEELGIELKEMGERVFEAEKLITRRKIRGTNKYLYLVKWANCSNRFNTWEPAENILCTRLFKDYDYQHNLMPQEEIPAYLAEKAAFEKQQKEIKKHNAHLDRLERTGGKSKKSTLMSKATNGKKTGKAMIAAKKMAAIEAARATALRKPTMIKSDPDDETSTIDSTTTTNGGGVNDGASTSNTKLQQTGIDLKQLQTIKQEQGEEKLTKHQRKVLEAYTNRFENYVPPPPWWKDRVSLANQTTITEVKINGVSCIIREYPCAHGFFRHRGPPVREIGVGTDDHENRARIYHQAASPMVASVATENKQTPSPLPPLNTGNASLYHCHAQQQTSLTCRY